MLFYFSPSGRKSQQFLLSKEKKYRPGSEAAVGVGGHLVPSDRVARPVGAEDRVGGVLGVPLEIVAGPSDDLRGIAAGLVPAERGEKAAPTDALTDRRPLSTLRKESRTPCLSCRICQMRAAKGAVSRFS